MYRDAIEKQTAQFITLVYPEHRTVSADWIRVLAREHWFNNADWYRCCACGRDSREVSDCDHVADSTPMYDDPDVREPASLGECLGYLEYLGEIVCLSTAAGNLARPGKSLTR